MPINKRERLFVAPSPQRLAPACGFGDVRAILMAWPRSGTQWLRNSIVAHGVPCGHEAVFWAGPTCWGNVRDIAVDVTGFAAPWVGALQMSGLHCVLITRHPGHLFGSILRRWGDIGELGDDPLPWLCRRWVRAMAPLWAIASDVIRIEDLWDGTYTVRQVLRTVGFEQPLGDAVDVARGDSTARRVPDDMLPGFVWQMAERFGYWKGEE